MGSSDSIHPAGLNRFVGRTCELNILIGELEQASSGDGRAIWIHGVDGIGKSRLIAEILRYAAWRGWRCRDERHRDRSSDGNRSMPARARADPRDGDPPLIVVWEDSRDRVEPRPRVLEPRSCWLMAGRGAAPPSWFAAHAPRRLEIGPLTDAEAIQLVESVRGVRLDAREKSAIRALRGHPGALLSWAMRHRARSIAAVPPRPSN